MAKTTTMISTSTLKPQQTGATQRSGMLLFWLAGALVLSALLSLLIGSTNIPLRALWEACVGSGDPLIRFVLLEIRLPRVLLAVLVGGSLGLAGAAMQGLLRNPLVEPGLLGVSAGAGLGAVTVFYLGSPFLFALPLGGMTGAAIAVLIVCLLAGRSASVQSFILAGVAVSSLCAALTSLVLNFSPNPYAAMEIVFWMLGSLSDRQFSHILLILPFIVIGSVLLLNCRRPLQALSLGEETAQSLGFSIRRVQFQMILGTAMAVGAAVSVTGAIGFVGLMVPHLLRPLVKGDPARLLPVSALGGALLLLWADIVVRVLPTGVELRIGVVTALVGSPIFLWVLLRSRKTFF